MTIIGNPLTTMGGDSGDRIPMSLANTLVNEMTMGSTLYCDNIDGYLGVDYVTTLWPGVFSGNTEIRAMSMLSLESVPAYAFMSCYNLENAYVPNASHIGQYAFSGCTSLVTARFAGGDIGYGAFSGCTRLGDIDFYNGGVPTTVGSYAFYECANVSPDPLLYYVNSIGQYAFAASAQTYAYSYNYDVTLDHLEYVGDHAFEHKWWIYCIDLPIVKNIGSYAFADTGLYRASVGQTIDSSYSDNSIDSLSEAFAGCNELKYVFIRASEVGDMTRAFADCTGISQVFMDCETVPSGMETAFEECPIDSLIVNETAYEGFISALPSLSDRIVSDRYW